MFSQYNIKNEKTTTCQLYKKSSAHQIISSTGNSHKSRRLVGPLGSSIIQGYNLVKSSAKNLADTMTDKRNDTGYWNQSSLTKNFAFDENDTDNFAHSQGNRHSEPGVMAVSGAKGNNANLLIVTERAPCGDCKTDIETVEGHLGRTMTVKHFVDHDEDAAENLFNLYSTWWDVPGSMYG